MYWRSPDFCTFLSTWCSTTRLVKSNLFVSCLDIHQHHWAVLGALRYLQRRENASVMKLENHRRRGYHREAIKFKNFNVTYALEAYCCSDDILELIYHVGAEERMLKWAYGLTLETEPGKKLNLVYLWASKVISAILSYKGIGVNISLAFSFNNHGLLVEKAKKICFKLDASVFMSFHVYFKFKVNSN